MRTVVRWFVGRLCVDEETARRELSGILRDAAENGTHRNASDGSHMLLLQGFTVVLSPDGAVITACDTIHFERTPSQVRDKVLSRYGHARQSDAEPVASPSAWRDRRSVTR